MWRVRYGITGDASEPHLINASMRCMMAFATATGRARMAERTEKDAPQVFVTAEEMAMLTGETEAQNEQKANLIEKVCAVCGKTFMASPGARKYCSAECQKVPKRANSRRQAAEWKKPQPEKEESRTKIEASARAAEEARRKESMAHLGELTRAAHEAGMSYGQYMAKKRMAEGVTEHG